MERGAALPVGFIGLAAARPSPRWPIVVVGIAFVALLHGVNDLFAGSLFHLLSAGLSLSIFTAYLTHRSVPEAPLPNGAPQAGKAGFNSILRDFPSS